MDRLAQDAAIANKAIDERFARWAEEAKNAPPPEAPKQPVPRAVIPTSEPTVVIPKSFYNPNPEGRGVDFLSIPKIGKLRVVFVSGITKLTHHYIGGKDTWSLPVCGGDAGCTYCPGDRRLYGYCHVVAPIVYVGRPGKMQLSHFILTLTPLAVQELEGVKLVGAKYDLWRTRAPGGGKKDGKVSEGKAVASLVGMESRLKLPPVINVQAYLMRRKMLSRWPVVTIGEVLPQLGIWREQA